MRVSASVSSLNSQFNTIYQKFNNITKQYLTVKNGTIISHIGNLGMNRINLRCDIDTACTSRNIHSG